MAVMVASSAPEKRASAGLAGGGTGGDGGGIVHQRGDRIGEARGIGDRGGRHGGIESGIDVGEVVDVRPVQHGGIEARRLDRVLTAVGDQRAAEEGDRRQAIEQAEFAERVGEIDVDLVEQRIAAAALGDRQPPCRRAWRVPHRRARDGAARGWSARCRGAGG